MRQPFLPPPARERETEFLPSRPSFSSHRPGLQRIPTCRTCCPFASARAVWLRTYVYTQSMVDVWSRGEASVFQFLRIAAPPRCMRVEPLIRAHHPAQAPAALGLQQQALSASGSTAGMASADGEHEEVALSSSISLLWVRHAVAVRQHLIAPDG